MALGVLKLSSIASLNFLQILSIFPFSFSDATGFAVSSSIGQLLTLSKNSLKLFFLSAHYSSPIDYNNKSIKEARKQKDWQKADQIRKNLLNLGYEIQDTDKGPVWRKK